MRLEPLHDNVLVQTTRAPGRSEGGIILPDSAKEKPREGVVLAVGPGKVVDGTFVKTVVAVGDKVVFGAYAGNDVKVGKDSFLLMKETEILGVLRD